MEQYLVFQLYGPLQSWGDVAVGEVRPTSGRPTRSAVLGLVAASLGIRRHEEERLENLAQSIGISVRVDAPGMRLTDYHTVQTPREKKKRVFFSRKDELGPFLEVDEDLTTILSRREYLADALFTICLWEMIGGAGATLEKIRESLSQPQLIPYLGRKSCPPALPFNPKIVEAQGPLEALQEYPLDDVVSENLTKNEGFLVFSDHCDQLRGAIKVMTTRDEPLHHGRRQFTTRQELMISSPEPLVE